MVTPPKREHDDFDTDDERLRYLIDRVNSAHEWIGGPVEHVREDGGARGTNGVGLPHEDVDCFV